eukprot:g9971.t1
MARFAENPFADEMEAIQYLLDSGIQRPGKEPDLDLLVPIFEILKEEMFSFFNSDDRFLDFVNSRTYGVDNTALHMAADCGLVDLVKFLVNHGADPNPKNSQNHTPLHMALKKGHIEVFKYLVSKIPADELYAEILAAASPADIKIAVAARKMCELEDHKTLKDHLQMWGFCMLETARDGNCFLHALIKTMRLKTNPDKLRERLVDELRSHQDLCLHEPGSPGISLPPLIT